ncbi:hypothetical protein L6164_013277 [Bauhinia variegata]|uniref:Uncharacterized protein n=1 Tax=Bauhinia variegata TaxID=167791 RepID=A0ACB9PI21_BAUVA|nr:hypothetical protein L6164_013277 [Bauhinia variegata]
MDITNLPEECICRILSYTSPKEVCRSSLVHSAFRAAADSDSLWEQFLPLDCKEIISQSSSPCLNSLSKKRLFFQLCDHPVLAADNEMLIL